MSPAGPAGRVIQLARHDAEPGVLPGRRDGAVRPLAVDLRGVHKHFGSVHAVRGVTLAVGSGEVMAFLGPNGAGKTSTIDMILGLSRPDAGAVEVYGMAPQQAVRKGLACGRTIRVTLPGADEAALRAMPGVGGVDVRGDTVLIHSGDTDAVALRLLTQTPARDLEITSRGLEEAFIALTGGGAASPADGSQAAT